MPRVTTCNICGDAIDLFETGRTGRKRRSDVKLCDSCRNGRIRSRKYPVKLLRNRDGSRCGICREQVDFSIAHPDQQSPSVDHIVPRARGGTDDPSNLQLAHLGCNQRKHARLPDEVAHGD